MEWQTCTQYSGNDRLLVHCPYLLDAQWRSYLFIIVLKGLADLVGHNFADTFEVPAKTHAVLLNDSVTQFSHVLVKDTVGFL